MFVRLFKGTGIGLVFLIIIAAGGLWFTSYINAATANVITATDPMPLWGALTSLMTDSPKSYVIFSFALMLVIAFLLIRFNISEFFINRRTFLPGILFVVLYSAFPEYMVLNAALPAALLIVIAIWRMLGAYRYNGTAYHFFDAAILISTASLFYANAVWFLFLVFVGAFVIRTPSFKEIFVAIIGALIPYAFLYSIWYLINSDITDLNVLIINNLFGEAPEIKPEFSLIAIAGLIVVNIIAGLYSINAEINTKKLKSRKAFSMFLWMLTVSIAVFAAVPSASVEIIAIASISAAFIISNYYVFARKAYMPEIFFALLIAMIIIARIWL